jgi:hypothetical protein
MFRRLRSSRRSDSASSSQRITRSSRMQWRRKKRGV